MASNLQFTKENPADVPVASAAGKLRLYVDLFSGSLSLKDEVGNVTTVAGSGTLGYYRPVRVATATTLPSYTRIGSILSSAINQPLPAIDGINVSVGDAVLLLNGASNVDNGIYSVTGLGSSTTRWTLTRRTDFSTTSTVVSGGIVPVGPDGVVNHSTLWGISVPDPITINTSNILFQQVGGAAGVAGGDLAGSFPNPTVVQARGIKTLSGVVSLEGSSAPIAGQGIVATSGTTAIWGPLQPGGTATGDLSGNYPAPTVIQARGLKTATNTVSVESATAPTAGQVLTAVNSTTAQWSAPAGGAPSGSASGDLSGSYPSPTVTQARGLKTSTTTVSIDTSSAPTTGQVLIASSSTAASWGNVSSSPTGSASGDLGGNYPSPTVTTARGLKTTSGNVVVEGAIAPLTGQVLTALNGITASWQSPTGGPPTGSAGGDLSGSYPNPSVGSASGLRTASGAVTISAAAAPTSGQVLTATSSTTAEWQTPATGGGSGSPTGSAGGDLGGLYPNPTVTRARGLRTATTTVVIDSSAAPSSGQVLVATSSTAASWSTPPGGAPSGAAGGDLSGTYPNPSVQQARGISTASGYVAINTTAPTSGQVLTATSSSGAQWSTLPAFNPVGAAGGDLGGTYPNPTVTVSSGLRSATTTVSVSTATAPTTGQVLTATSSTTATWQTPTGGGSGSPTGPAGGDLSGTYPNPVVVTARGLKTASTTVVIEGSPAPSNGQFLIATGSTAASWGTAGPQLIQNLSGTINWYVNGSTGSDTNDGSISTPWATFSRAWNERLKYQDVTGVLTINFSGAGPYVLPDSWGATSCSGTIIIKGDTSAYVDYWSGTLSGDTGTAGALSTTTNFSGVPGGGCIVRYTSGTMAGVRLPVLYTFTNFCALMYWGDGNYTGGFTGNAITISDPGTILSGSGKTIVGLSGNHIFVDFKFTGSLTIQSAELTFRNCWFTGAVTVRNSVLQNGTHSSISNWYNTGMAVDSANFTVEQGSKLSDVVYSHRTSGTYLQRGGTHARLRAISMDTTAANFYGGDAEIGNLTTQSNSRAISIQQGSNVQIIGTTQFNVTSGSCITVRDGTIRLGAGSNINGTTTDSAGYAVYCTTGGKCIAYGGSLPGITGGTSGADIKTTTTTAAAWSTITSTPKLDPTDGSLIMASTL